MMDRNTPSFFGRRRGWLIITQLVLVLAIFAMALAPEIAPSLLPLQAQTSPLGQNQTPYPASWTGGDGNAWY